MLRIVKYRLTVDGEWLDGILHTFNDGHAVIENKATAELEVVPVKKDHLKFGIVWDQWARMNADAQAQAQAQATKRAITAPNIAEIRR